VRQLYSPASAILTTVTFGVVVIGILTSSAPAGAPHRTGDLKHGTERNLLYYGVGGIVVAAAALKLFDLVVPLFHGY
jgi:K+-transporting ATPase ATPase B chain